MKGNHFKLKVAVILLFLVLISTPGQTQAQTQTQPGQQAEGIDLILLIDESGSMGGHGEHPQPNDPNNKRNELLHIILPEIIEAAYKGSIFRVSIVEFGSRHGSGAQWQPQVTLSVYPIQKPKTGEDKLAYFKKVSRELDRLRKERTRGYSDHGGALELALIEISKMQSQKVPAPLGHIGVKERLKVIFLITDGMPFVRDSGGAPIPLVQLKREIKEKVEKFPAQKAILFVFGLNDADKYWEEMGAGDFWDLIARTTEDDRQNKGYAQFIDNHVKIIEQVLPVLSKYTNPPGVSIIHGDTFDCPPYLKAVEFIVEFPHSFMKVTQVLEITQPEGDLLDTTNAREEKVNAYIDVPYPRPGVWRFNRKDKNVRVMVKKVYQTVKFVSPRSPVHLQAPHKIKFKAYGPGKNNAFVQYDKFPLTANIFIETPQNTRNQLNAALDPNDPGVFISTADYRFQDSGQYKVEFEASTVSSSGSPLVVLKSNKETVQVTDNTPVKIVLEKPTGKTISSFSSIKQDFRIGFFTIDDNRRIPLQDILKTPGKIGAAAEVMDAASKTKIISTDFDFQPQNDSMTGAVEMKLPFMDILKILLNKRDLNVTVNFDNRFVKDKYFLAPAQTDSSLYQFPLKIREWVWTYLALLVILLLILALIGWLVLLFGRTICSKDIPILVYRQDSYVPDDQFTQKMEVIKRKMKIKKGDKTFFIPDSSEVWKPEIKIKQNCTDKGVNITVTYEKFGKERGYRRGFFRKLLEKLKIVTRDKNKERFRKVNIQTTYPKKPFRHRIKELGDQEMVFELRIKEF